MSVLTRPETTRMWTVIPEGKEKGIPGTLGSRRLKSGVISSLVLKDPVHPPTS